MPFIIEIITLPEDYLPETTPTDLMKQINHQYVGSIIVSVMKRRFKKADIIQQIVLTENKDEAEQFTTLLDAQKYWKRLNRINHHYLFHIIETS